jgi:hypothetical protein
MNDEKNINTVRLYAMGGVGFNAGSQLENFRDHKITGAAALDIAYGDTSDSDLQANISPEHCFFLPGAKGSGKFQGQHLDAIDAHAKSILQQFKPSSTLNIFLSSGSGGSGAPMVSTLASELLATGHNVIAIIVGTTADKREIGNTRNHILSLANVAEDTDKPLVAAYFQNSPETPREEVDKAIIALIGGLCVLFSGKNHGLDPQDLFNWLHFNGNKTTSYGARLAQLGMFEGAKRIGNIGNVISVATLTTPQSGHEIEQTPEYQVVGRLSPNTNQVLIDKAPIHFVVSTGLYGNVLNDLEGRLAELKRVREAFVEAPITSAPVAGARTTKRGIVVDD